jgi:nucleoid-associated protein YgaU
VAKTDAWVEYQDAVEVGLGRARRHAGGAWRALGGLAAQAGTAGVAGAATAGAAAAAVLAVSAATVVTIGVFTGALDGEQGERGLPGSVITVPSTEVVTTTTLVETTTTLTIEPPVTVSVTYIVQSGDTLWKVARDECGGDAPARELVRRVLSLWVVNLELVGSDPNSIDAGQELEVVCEGVLD